MERLLPFSVDSSVDFVPIVVADLHNVFAVAVVEQVHRELAPNSYLHRNISLIEVARLIVHFLLCPILFPVLQHVLEDLRDVLTALFLLFCR